MEWHFNHYYPPELYHYGILGQKWGVRRFQNPDGTLTEAGRKRYRVDSEGNIVAKTKSEIKADKKKARAERTEQQRTTRLEREHETEEKKKARIIKSRDPRLIYKNKDMFDYKELSDLYNLINAENNMKKLAQEREKTGRSYVEAMSKLNKVINVSADTVNAGSKFIKAMKDVGKLFEQPTEREKAEKEAAADAKYYQNWYLAEQNKKNLSNLSVDVSASDYLYKRPKAK